MRRNHKVFAVTALVLVLLLTLLPAVPAMAYSVYGQLYDSTDQLDKSRCETMGQQLSDLSEEKQIDIHVDVVDDLEGKGIDDYAKIFYTQYGYGYQSTGDGILLMIYLTEDGDGLEYEDYDIVFGGQNKESFRTIVSDMYSGVSQYLNEDSFSGDLQEDNDAFFHAIECVISAVKGESGTAAAGTAGSLAQTEAAESAQSLAQTEAAESAQSLAQTEAAESIQSLAEDGLPPLEQVASSQLVWDQIEGTYVKDAAGLMSDAERQTLESKAGELADRYGTGVYVLTVDDYRSYGGSSSIELWTEKLYLDNQLGLGSEQNGVILALSMAERDYCLKIYGSDALFAYTDYAQGQLTDRFVSSFRNNDWYGGFSAYLNFGEKILKEAADGTPMERTVNWAGMIGGSSLLSLLIGFITGKGRVGSLRRTMKNTGIKRTAVNYISHESGMYMRSKQDHYVNTTVNRVRVSSSQNKTGGHGGGGGGTSVNSHGFSGGSGKF